MVEFFLIVLLISVITALVLVTRLWGLRNMPGAASLLFANLALGLWSFSYVMEIVTPRLADKVLWAKIQYLGIAFLPVWFLFFILTYSGRAGRVQRWWIALLLVIPTLTVTFTFTNEMHRWMWTTIDLQSGWRFAPLALGHGTWFWIHSAYCYVMLLWSTVLLVQFARSRQKLYASQSTLMLVGLLAPWVSNILFIFGLNIGPGIDLTPLAFSVTTLLLALAFIRFRLFDILPVAYPSIFQAISDAVIVLDASGRIVDANPTAQRILPSLGDKKLGDRLELDLPPDETHQELTLSSGEDTHVYILRSIPLPRTILRDNGRLVILTDITALKRVQDRMRLQSTALRAAGNGILITNAAGVIEWVNPAFTTLTGYSEQEVLGQNPRILNSGMHTPEFYHKMWNAILSGNVWHGELTNRRKNGDLYFEESVITPVSQDDGTITHFVAIKQDITDRIHAEEKLRQAHEDALEANRLKTQLLANVSHDLRTPLGAIIGYAEMLQEGVYGSVTAEQHGAAAEIIDSSNQVLMFVNNLISQAQIETGRVRMVYKRFPAKELIDSLHSMVGLAAQKKGLAVAYQVDPALPPRLCGDPYWLRQVVLNLLTNAVKFTERGSITVRLWQIDATRWAIEVSDTGIGISEEAQRTIFEPYYQVENTTSRHMGSGLGLFIIKELAGQMGGSVSVQSRLGEGSTFRVILPLQMQENG